MSLIRITIKVVAFLVFGGWFDQAHHKWLDFAHHKEKGQRMQRIKRIHPDPAFGGRTDYADMSGVNCDATTQKSK
jgi:hypothetical protein